MRTPHKVQVGERGPTRRIGPVTQTDIVRFAGASGDFNPLHHDPEFVRSAGFPGVIAMGQFQAGLLAGWLSDWLGVEHLRSYQVRFAAPVFVGDHLTFEGEIVAVAQESGESVAEVTLSVTRGADVVLSGEARVVVLTG
jgi:3-hydroxybutyryl-CoA dehydratase